MVDAVQILQNGYDTVLSTIGSVSDNISAKAIGTAAAATGAVGLGVAVATAVKKKRKKSKKKTKKSKKRTTKKKRKLKFGSKAYRKKYLSKRRRKQKKPYTAGKRRDTSHKRIRYTSNNQPYIILSNGRARFIKRSSVRRSRKLKGGRY